LRLGAKSFIAPEAGRGHWHAVFGADGYKLAAHLHQAREENRGLPEGSGLTDEANARALHEIHPCSTQKLYIPKMDVDVS
jgi:hypothetical protein